MASAPANRFFNAAVADGKPFTTVWDGQLYDFAMFVIPKLSVPDYKFNDTAFRLEVLSWTLPCSMCAVLAFLGGLVFAIAPKRSVRTAVPAVSPS